MRNDPTHLCEELGDVLMQVMFHSDIEADAGRFDLSDVADMSVKKLISRHPHVFGEVAVSGSDEVLANWDVLKRIEKNHETVSDALSAVAKSLPGLWRAEKIQKKAANVGFDWPDVGGALDKAPRGVSKSCLTPSGPERKYPRKNSATFSSPPSTSGVF